jgi:hypothetical protein
MLSAYKPDCLRPELRAKVGANADEMVGMIAELMTDSIIKAVSDGDFEIQICSNIYL